MFLKEKFKARCEARLKKARERAAKRTPWMSSSSDGFECDDSYLEEEENIDDDLDDEVCPIITFHSSFLNSISSSFFVES
jgi:hypothetical protein